MIEVVGCLVLALFILLTYGLVELCDRLTRTKTGGSR